jgi:hypothetical protein
VSPGGASGSGGGSGSVGGSGSGGASGTGGERAVPYVCPFCGEEDLRPAPEGRWHCRSCLRLFTVTFHGLEQPGAGHPAPAYTTAPPTPASGIRLVDPATTRGGDRDDPEPDEADTDADLDDTDLDDPSTPGSPR